MALKASYAAKEDIPQGLEEHYKEEGGKWVLQAEGVVTQERYNQERARLDEFRTNNVKLKKDLEELGKKRFLTPEEQEKFDHLQQQQEEIENKKLIASGEVDKIVENKTRKMRQELEGRANAATEAQKKADERLATTRKRLEAEVVKGTLASVLTNVGVPKKGAMNDIFNRAFSTWRLDDEDNLIAVDSSGNPLSGADGKALQMVEWAGDLVKQADYLFEPNKGGGASGGNKGNNNGGNNGSVRVIPGDHESLSRNLEAVAAGKATVAAPEG